MQLEPGKVIADRFRLERPLAKGGMGAVWVAQHLLLDSPVAIKFIDSEKEPSQETRARFLQEAKASYQMKHPHVVQVLDYGIEENTPFMVMELLEGEDVDAYLKRKGRLTLEETFRILDPLSKALRRAHSMGLVHRDLKPSNLFLARAGDEVIVKVLDFGIAKQIQTDGSGGVTNSGALIGSPRYMSPEQVRFAKQVDHRSDLWSTGVILYEALTGRKPFEHDSFGGLLIAICTDPWTPPSQIVPELPAEMDAFFARALERNRDKRFQSVDELVKAFAKIAGIRVSTPYPVSARHVKQPDAGVDPNALTIEHPDLNTDQARGDPDPTVASPESLPRPADGGTLDSASLTLARNKPLPRVIGMVSAALVVVGTLAWWMAGDPPGSRLGIATESTHPTSTVAPSPVPPTSTADVEVKLLRTARLSIEPGDATVEVDGHKVDLDGGTVEIQGKLGSTHAVKVSKDGHDVTEQVVIAQSGAMPEKVKLVMPMQGQAAASVRPSAPARNGTPAPTATTKAAPTPSKPPQPDVERHYQ